MARADVKRRLAGAAGRRRRLLLLNGDGGALPPRGQLLQVRPGAGLEVGAGRRLHDQTPLPGPSPGEGGRNRRR